MRMLSRWGRTFLCPAEVCAGRPSRLRVDGELVTTPTLVSLSYSPFSERARWALDHHRIGYQVVNHVPVLGELRLRRLAKGKQGRVTAPVLIANGAALCDSWDIARYAD